MTVGSDEIMGRLRGLGLRKLGTNIGLTLARQVIGFIFGTTNVLVLARLLGAEGNGQYNLVLLLPSLLLTFSNFGLSAANVYFISRGNIAISGALRANLRLWLILSILISALSLPVVLAFGDQLFPGTPLALLLFGLAAYPLALLQMFLTSLLHGAQDFRRLNTVQAATPVVSLLLILMVVAVFRLGVEGALAAYLVTQVFTVTFAYLSLRPHLRHAASAHQPHLLRDYWRQTLGYGWKAHIGNIITFVNYRADLFLLNILLNPAAVGVYAIAVRVAEQLWMLSSAVAMVLLPRVAELHSDEEKRRMITPIVARWVLYLTAAMAFAILVFGQIILKLLGPDYAAAYGAIVGLLPGIVLLVVSRVLTNDLAARGRPELNIYASLVTLVVEVGGILLLVPRYNLLGAALASSLAYGAQTVAALYLYARLSKNPWWLPLVPQPTDRVMIQQGIMLARSRLSRER